MAALHFMAGQMTDVRRKAVMDAQKMQSTILKEMTAQGKEIPPYELMELIGKGSFGRVYKATNRDTKKLVAVKIISIEEGDSMNPTNSDTFSDILKEVNTLKMLNSSGARNINMVVDSLLVDQSIWMVTEYCAGGSVATLMRPTGGLPEKWIIPILREVAEAMSWVHKEGIIHRDIKCANVLVTDAGGVQLCDFGVAGIINTRFDKRSTVTGTLQWMAPELFESAAYGTEVDIWAFGSMVYEVASGLPPNATTLQNIPNIGKFLKNNCPRLEGDQYSDLLKDMVAYCLVDDPAMRPRIEEIQQHPYIADTEDRFPTASLSKLVKAYRLWETQGGSRRSLFAVGGAQGQLEDVPPMPAMDDWNFNTMKEAPHTDDPDASAVYDAYGPGVDFPGQAPPPQKNGPRRRRRPPNLKGPTAPLEKVFDPNTLTNYRDNARAWYGRGESPPLTSDLPLRDHSQGQTVRESLINLDLSYDGTGTDAHGSDTIRASQKPPPHDNRRTQDWTFPVMAGGGSGQPDNHEDAMPSLPPAFNPPTEIYSRPSANSSAVSLQSLSTSRQPLNRASVASLIDLDEGFVEDNYSRPSTSQSDAAFASDTEERFGLEKHTSRRFEVPHTTREPSLYVPSTSQPREPSLYVAAPSGGPREPSLYVSDTNTTSALANATNGTSKSGYSDAGNQADNENDDGTIEIPDLNDGYREPSIYVTSSARTDREPSLYIDLDEARYERPESQMTDYTQYQQPKSHTKASSNALAGGQDANGVDRESGIFIPSFSDVKRQASMIIPDESRTDRLPSLLIPEDMGHHSSALAAANHGNGGNTEYTTGGYNGMYEDLGRDTDRELDENDSPPLHRREPNRSNGSSAAEPPAFWRQDSVSSSVASYSDFAASLVPFEVSMAPDAPTGNVMEGRCDAGDMKMEMQRLISAMQDHLCYTGSMLEKLPVRKAELRRGREETPP
ncbi:Serine/threonine protein kinase [Ceratocystis lukuohia]|uniref:non-specific serine/threonine protein kinase n=1 Tax=Ceratocystis lukuohia TaxID=2019550 RepID=A0ABR4MRC3_9PEZI